MDVLVEDIVVEQEAGSALQAVESNCSDQSFHEEQDRDMELHDGNDDFGGVGDDNDDSSREKVAKEEGRKRSPEMPVGGNAPLPQAGPTLSSSSSSS